MNLYILRHASAGTRRVNPLLDHKRPLDKDGKRHTLQLAHVLNAMKLQFDLIVSSPLKRSLQTATLVGTEMGYEATVQQSAALSPEATFPEFQKLLEECGKSENVLVVGHNPNINSFLGCMMVAPGTAAGASVRLRKGSLARLNLASSGHPGTPLVHGGRPAALQWLLDPRTVRALYATSTTSSRRKTSRK